MLINMIAKELRFRIKEAIEHYNEYRSPEVNAALLRLERDGGRFIVSFTGQFCNTCGVNDYFEDLLYDLLDKAKIKTKVADVKRIAEAEGFKVTYKIEG